MWFYQQQMLKTIGFDDPLALQQQAPTMLVHSVTVSAIATTIYFLIVAACFFHRVAGPIFRLKRHMLEVLDDQPVGKLQVRNSDQLLDVIDIYNQLLAKAGVLDDPEAQPMESEQFSRSA